MKKISTLVIMLSGAVLRSNNEVSLIFPILIVHDNDHFTGCYIFD